MWGCFLMSGVKILHFLKDWWKSIPIHQNYTMALRFSTIWTWNLLTLSVLSHRKCVTNINKLQADNSIHDKKKVEIYRNNFTWKSNWIKVVIFTFLCDTSPSKTRRYPLEDYWYPTPSHPKGQKKKGGK